MTNRRKTGFTLFPTKLEQALFRALQPGAKELKQTEWLDDFRHALGYGYVLRYDKDWVAFNYLFYAANFIKAKTAFHELVGFKRSYNTSYRILDLGCGSGAASAGVLQCMFDKTVEKTASIEFVGVDRDATQLALYCDRKSVV